MRTGSAIDVEEIRGGVDSAKVPVDIEWVDRCRTRETLRGDCLDYVAFAYVRFECSNMGFIARLADVGGVLLVEGYGRLWWKGNLG